MRLSGCLPWAWGCALLCGAACAQAAPFDYKLGAISVHEGEEQFILALERPVTVQIEGGGRFAPLFTLDEAGNFYIGAQVFEPVGGRRIRSVGNGKRPSIALAYGASVTVAGAGYRIRHGRSTCAVSMRALGIMPGHTATEALMVGTVEFRASEQAVVALVTRTGDDKSDTNYLAGPIEMATCSFRPAKLGNPDLLVELNGSRKGGWWLTGSIEQTLLRSADGQRWRPVKLPEDVSSLVSAYIVDDREIWLAAIMADSDLDSERDPGIGYSCDGGRSWAAVSADDPLLKRIPKGWLEGRRRVGYSRWASKHPRPPDPESSSPATASDPDQEAP